MAHYLKSEWYRITRSKTLYLYTLVLAAVTLAANTLLFVMNQLEPGFPYGTVHFSLSNVVGMIPMVIALAGVLAILLYADDLKRGTFKNALLQGMPRAQLFLAKCLMSVLAGVISMAGILLVYVGSAVIMLHGPAAESVQVLLGGMGAALPTLIAVIVLALACLHLCSGTASAFLLWISIVFVVPSILHSLGLYFEPVAQIANWLPTVFFQSEVIANRSGFDCLWETPSGLMKCLVTGGGFMVLFAALGLWRTRKMEL